MGSKLSREILANRLHEAVGLNYMTVASIIAGVNLAVAADSLVRFLTAPSFPWDRFPLWLASFECIVIAYSALTLAPIVAAYSPSWRDHLFPLLIGLTVLLLFLLLPGTALVAWWYLFAALTSASRVALSRHLATELRRLECEDDVRVVIQDFGHRMMRMSRFHMSTGAYFLLVSIGLLLLPALDAWQWLFGALGAVALLLVIVLFEQARASLVSELR
ncbi:MAG: hypothetical protein ACM3JD_05735 [Rudaea sp.]